MWLTVIIVQVILVICLVVGGSSWFISQHDKRAEKYKHELEICKRKENE